MDCCGYGYVILGNFIAGQIILSADKMPVDKIPFKITREDKMLAILWDREAKMPILSYWGSSKLKKLLAENTSVKTCSRKYLHNTFTQTLASGVHHAT